MFNMIRLWVIGVALFLAACSITEPVNWAEKIEESDRKSSIKGMLTELSAYDEQIDIMKVAGEVPTYNQVDALLSLDHFPVNEGEEDQIGEIFMKVADARAIQLDLEDEYIDLKKVKLNTPVPDGLVQARVQTLKIYRDSAPELLAFLQKKVSAKRYAYGDSLIVAHKKDDETKLPCRHQEIVDALRRIGNGLRESDLDKFKASPLYKNTTDLFADTLYNDIQQPPRTALIAASTLKQWEVGEHIDTYEKLITEDQIITKDPIHFDLRNAIIKLLTQFATEKHTKILLKILNTPPENQQISYIALSATKLGDLKVDEAIDRLVECLWLDDARGRSATSECRLALNKLNREKVIKSLLKAFKRQNPAIEERGNRLNYGHTGLIEAKAAEVLGDLNAKDTLSILVTSLEHDDVNPAPLAADAALATFFVKGQVQKTISIAHALAMLGKPEGTKPLLKILQNDAKLFEYKLASLQQLAYLGRDTPIKGLLKIFDKKLERYDLGNRDLKAQFAKTIAAIISHKDSRNLKGFKKSVAKEIKLSQEWIKETQEWIKSSQERQKKLEEEITALKAQTKKMKDDKVKIPAPPKREKVEKMKDKEEYKKKRLVAKAAHEEALKKYEEALTEDEKKLRELERTIAQKQKLKTQEKNAVFEKEREAKIYQAWEKSYQEITAQLKVLDECGAKSGCWARKLSSTEAVPVRMLAAYTLARPTADSTFSSKAFYDHLQEKDPTVRGIILFGLARHVQSGQLESLKIARKSFSDRDIPGNKDKSLKGTVYSLDLIIASLTR